MAGECFQSPGQRSAALRLLSAPGPTVQGRGGDTFPCRALTGVRAPEWAPGGKSRQPTGVVGAVEEWSGEAPDAGRQHLRPRREWPLGEVLHHLLDAKGMLRLGHRCHLQSGICPLTS